MLVERDVRSSIGVQHALLSHSRSPGHGSGRNPERRDRRCRADRVSRDLDQNRFPVSRLVDIWNALPSAEPVKRFRDRQVALRRVWAALEALSITSLQAESKQARVVALLQRPSGATMDDLTAATGWQRHSVRGVLSGVIRKKRGMVVTSAREGEQRVYRVVA